MPLSAPNRTVDSLHSRTPRGAEPFQRSTDHDTRSFALADATSLRVNPPPANSTRRDQSSTTNSLSFHLGMHAPGHNSRPLQSTQRLQPPPSSGTSQDTSSTKDTDLVFTPPSSEDAMSPIASVHDSSQESQLLRLSQVAAAQERIPDGGIEGCEDGASRKRMADGSTKHTREKSCASPVRAGGHSRNTSTVSVASTTGSKIGEVRVQ